MMCDLKLFIKNNGIYCPSWTGRIENDLGRMSGISFVKADDKTQIVEVKFDDGETSEDQVRDKLASMGFEPE